MMEATEAPGELSSVGQVPELHNSLDMFTELDAPHFPRVRTGARI